MGHFGSREWPLSGSLYLFCVSLLRMAGRKLDSYAVGVGVCRVNGWMETGFGWMT